MATNKIKIEMDGENAEVRLAKLVAELTREGIAFSVEEVLPDYVITITGY